ncbi:hypothetical protein PAHAL_9G235500 [Panicum hallii]|uniref:Uncharacterized protein n=1 Tax=Panicum hallii TaxID=206008 RepID=A0A2T8I296_9POAL|nr:hypothetical protein PAHAL_9G235500 [Panicum hallii]
MENYQAQDDDALFVLQLLEEADLDEWLSGGLHQSPLQDTVSHHKMEGRKSGRRGMRKRRISPWDTFIFGGTTLGRNRKYITRKNNSRWTGQVAKFVESLPGKCTKIYAAGSGATIGRTDQEAGSQTSISETKAQLVHLEIKVQQNPSFQKHLESAVNLTIWRAILQQDMNIERMVFFPSFSDLYFI